MCTMITAELKIVSHPQQVELGIEIETGVSCRAVSLAPQPTTLSISSL